MTEIGAPPPLSLGSGLMVVVAAQGLCTIYGLKRLLLLAEFETYLLRRAHWAVNSRWYRSPPWEQRHLRYQYRIPVNQQRARTASLAR